MKRWGLTISDIIIVHFVTCFKELTWTVIQWVINLVTFQPMTYWRETLQGSRNTLNMCDVFNEGSLTGIKAIYRNVIKSIDSSKLSSCKFLTPK